MVDQKSRSDTQNAPPALLVVDDDAIITATLSSGLRSAGYQVYGVTSPLQALELCERRKFDLALVDQQMAVMTGVELVRQLRDTHDLYSIFVSAYGSTELVDEAAAAGVLSYFIKPVDPMALSPAIKAALTRVQDLRAARSRELTLQGALAAERDINTAVGILMERLQLTRNESFDHLRQYARSQRLKAANLASELVAAVNGVHNLVDAIFKHKKKMELSAHRTSALRSSDE